MLRLIFHVCRVNVIFWECTQFELTKFSWVREVISFGYEIWVGEKSMKNVLVFIVSFLVYGWAHADAVRIFCDNSPPASYESEDGSVVGFSTDVVRELQKRVGNTSEIKIYPWKRALSMATSEPNVLLFTTARNPSRENKFHWIIQVTERRTGFWGRAGTPLKIAGMEDAKKLKAIGIWRGTNREDYLRVRGFTNLDAVEDKVQNLFKLLAGRIDLVFISGLEIATLAKDSGISLDQFELKYTVFSNESYAVMSKPGTPMETVRRWKLAAREMKEDGTFKRIGEKWVNNIKRDYGFQTEARDKALFYWKD